MKYTKSQEKSEVTVKFETTEEEWKAAEMKAYQETKGKYNVPGFRKGKAPKHMIETMYGAAVFADDTMDILIQEGWEQFLGENKDEAPIDRPSASIDAFDGKKVEFTLKFPVAPEVNLGEYKGVKITKAVYDVTDEQVEAEIKGMLERSAREEETEEAAASGDVVNLDYSGSVDGVKFDGGTAEKYSLTLGSNTFIPGFEDQLIGVKKGDEKDVKVTFTEDYHADELKGKEAVFACKINSVSKRTVPEADDAWAKDVSEFETLAEYKASIKDRMIKSGEQRAKRENENAVINAIVDNSSADIPEVMIESYLDDMLRDMEMRLYYQGMKIDDYFKYMGVSVDDWKKERHDDARRGALTRLCLETIIKREGIAATDEEAEKKYADSLPEPDDGSEKRKPDERELAYLKDEIAMEKLLDFLLGNAVMEEGAKEEKKTTAKKSSTTKTTASKKTATKKTEDKE